MKLVEDFLFDYIAKPVILEEADVVLKSCQAKLGHLPRKFKKTETVLKLWSNKI